MKGWGFVSYVLQCENRYQTSELLLVSEQWNSFYTGGISAGNLWATASLCNDLQVARDICLQPPAHWSFRRRLRLGALSWLSKICADLQFTQHSFPDKACSPSSTLKPNPTQSFTVNSIKLGRRDSVPKQSACSDLAEIVQVPRGSSRTSGPTTIVVDRQAKPMNSCMAAALHPMSACSPSPEHMRHCSRLQN